MPAYERTVFISYAWGGESEQVANQIDTSLRERDIHIVRDKRDLRFKGSIQEFMERIGRGHCVIVIISDKYLRSANCMFELVEIAEHKQFHERIFPVVLKDAKIYNATERLDYVEFWEQEKEKLNERTKRLSDLSHIEGVPEELNNYDRFRDQISRLTSILKDMNTLTPDMHRGSNFAELYDAIGKRMNLDSDVPAGEGLETSAIMESDTAPASLSPRTRQLDSFELIEALANPDPMVCLVAAKSLSGRSDLGQAVLDIPLGNPAVKEAVRSVLRTFPEKSAELIRQAIKNSGETGESWGRVKRASEYCTPVHAPYLEPELFDIVASSYDPELLRHTLTAFGNIARLAYYTPQVEHLLRSDYLYQKCLSFALEGAGRNFVLAEDQLEIECASNHLLHLIGIAEKRQESVGQIFITLGDCSVRHVDQIMSTWLESNSSTIKKLGLQVLGRVRLSRSATKVLSVWQKHQGTDVGEEAAASLMCIGEKNALRTFLKYETKIIGEALMSIEDESFNQFLPQVLENPRFAWLAYRAIGLRQRTDKLSLLKDALFDSSPPVRGSAALALARLGERDGIRKAYEEANGEDERIFMALAALTADLVEYSTVESQLRLDLAKRSFSYAIEAQDDILSVLQNCGSQSAEKLMQAWKPFYGRGDIVLGIRL